MDPVDNGTSSDTHRSFDIESSSEVTQSSTSTVPPYWTHRRNEPYASIKDNKPAPITLEDHTEGPDALKQSQAMWAKGVAIDIDDYVIIAGTVPNVGKFVVWNCRIDTLDVSCFSFGSRGSTGCPSDDMPFRAAR